MTAALTDHDAAVSSPPDPTPDRPPLTEDVVQRIIELDDPALRNLWITESYADLASRLLAVFETDQSWCTFATWASNTAGLSIRGEELPSVMDALFPDAVGHLSTIVDVANQQTAPLRRFGLARLLERAGVEALVADAVSQVSTFIAHGNTLVYAELAPLFVRFVEWLERGHLDDDVDVDDALAALGIPAPDDEPLVHTAFRHYALAARCGEPSLRAQLVLTANIAAVLHEQQRLQADITGALDAGLLDVGDELEQLCHRSLPGPLQRWVLSRIRRHVAPHVEHLWEHLATRMMMTLDVPGETLHLGRDLPPLPDGDHFPDRLRHIDHADLERLLTTWDPTSGTTVGSGAEDWADLHQRMGYIVNLFRSRQQRLELTTSPFSPKGYAEMRAGLALDAD